MRLKELQNYFKKEFSEAYPSEEIQSFFQLLAEAFLGYSRIQISLNAEERLSEEIIQKFEEAIHRLLKHEPIQYILGETEFYSLPFKVSPATLIPRPETEELVDWIIQEFRTQLSGFRILDVGTGSGCIAVALAKNLPKAEVSALDVSEEALSVARENAQLNNASVEFFQTDILSTETLPQQYNCIVSNPPYVRELEKKAMQKNVLEHEPERALYVTDEDPLLFYRQIAQLAQTHLTPKGQLFFEINEYLEEEMTHLMKTEGFSNILVKNDFRGKPRMLKATLL